MFYVSFLLLIFFFFNDTATTEIYTLSLHDALPICLHARGRRAGRPRPRGRAPLGAAPRDRKSTRLNSSHVSISYAVFCLKKKKKKINKIYCYKRKMKCLIQDSTKNSNRELVSPCST